MKNVFASTRQYLDNLNPRERKLVLGMAWFIAAVFTWLVLIEPATNTLIGADSRRSALLEQANKVTEAALTLDAMRGSRSQIRVKAEELQARVQRLAGEAGIANNMVLSSPTAGLLEVALTDAPAAGVLRWLALVDGLSQVTVTKASLTKPDAGVVNGNVTIEQKAGAQ